MRLRLADHADLNVYYEADAARYTSARRRILQTVTIAAFIHHYEKCPSIGFMCDENPIGGILVDRGYAHLAVLPEYHGRWAWLWESALERLFSIQPEVLAEVEIENRACVTFLKHDGWPVVSVTNGKITFLIARDYRKHRRRQQRLKLHPDQDS